MIPWWLVLILVVASAGGSSLVTLRLVPRMIARMSDASRAAFLDRVEVAERGRTG